MKHFWKLDGLVAGLTGWLLFFSLASPAAQYEPAVGPGAVWWKLSPNSCVSNGWTDMPVNLVELGASGCTFFGLRSDGVVTFFSEDASPRARMRHHFVEQYRGQIRSFAPGPDGDLLLLCDGSVAYPSVMALRIPSAIHRAPVIQLVYSDSLFGALFEDGRVLAWSNGGYPTLPAFLGDEDVAQIAVTRDALVTRYHDGTVRVRSKANWTDYPVPPDFTSCRDILPHSGLVLALDAGGVLSAWMPSVPRLIPELRTLPPIRRASAIGEATLFIAESGELWEWNGLGLPSPPLPSRVTNLPPELQIDLVVRVFRGTMVAQKSAVSWSPTAATAAVIPFQRRVYVGQSASFTATVRCGLPTSVRWSHAGRLLAGQNQTTLTVTPQESSEGGIYEMEATTAGGEVLRAQCYLRVDPVFDPGPAYSWSGGSSSVRSENLPGGFKDAVITTTGDFHAIDSSGRAPVTRWAPEAPPTISHIREIIPYRQFHPVMLTEVGTVWTGWTEQLILPRSIVQFAGRGELSPRDWLYVLDDGSLWTRSSDFHLQTFAWLSTNRVIQAAVGADFNLVLLSDGSVRGWGENTTGTLDLPSSVSSGIVYISAGDTAAVAVRADGSVIAWGDAGQNWVQPPERLPPISKVSVGSSNVLALTRSGELVFWGADGDTTQRQNAAARGKGFVDISASGNWFAALRAGLPRFVRQPSDVEGELGQRVELQASVSGKGAYLLQWYRDLAPIPGATNETYGVESVSRGDVGIYQLVAACSAGERASLPVRFDLSGPPQWIVPPQGLEVETWSVGQLEARVTGSSPLSYQWFKDGVPLPAQTQEVLDFELIRSYEAGHYSLEVSNRWGKIVSDPVELRVSVPSVVQGRRLLVARGSIWGHLTNANSRQLVIGALSDHVQVRAPVGLGMRGAHFSPLMPSNGLGFSSSVFFRYFWLPPFSIGVWSNLSVRMYSRDATWLWATEPYPTTQMPLPALLDFNFGSGINTMYGFEPRSHEDALEKVIPSRSSKPNSPLFMRKLLVLRPVLYDPYDEGFFLDCEISADVNFTTPRFVKEPIGGVVRMGGSWRLEVLAETPGLPIGYRWFHNGAPIPGQFGPVLTLTNFSPKTAGDYYVQFQDLIEQARSRTVQVLLDPSLTAVRTDDGVSQLVWGILEGVLETASQVEGPWVEVTGATSPFVLEAQQGERVRFFRLRPSAGP